MRLRACGAECVSGGMFVTLESRAFRGRMVNVSIEAIRHQLLNQDAGDVVHVLILFVVRIVTRESRGSLTTKLRAA